MKKIMYLKLIGGLIVFNLVVAGDFSTTTEDVDHVNKKVKKYSDAIDQLHEMYTQEYMKAIFKQFYNGNNLDQLMKNLPKILPEKIAKHSK